MKKFIVAKFGGSNLKNHHDYTRLAQVVSAYNQRLVIVVSAFHGLTNRLLAVLEKSVTSLQDVDDFIVHLHANQTKLIRENIKPGLLQDEAETEISIRISQLYEILREVHALGKISDATHDLVLSYGERFSSLLTSRVLLGKGFEAEEVLPDDLGLVTDGRFGFASVDFRQSAGNVNRRLTGDKIYVVPGFYGISPDGQVNLFGRGGSDYTAAAIARCIGAASLDVWKDVDGFLTADPGIVPDASTIGRLSYNEAAELAYFGARILHPETVGPLVKNKIPLRILNIESFEKEIIPSTIVNGSVEIHPGVIKSITYSDDFGILRLKGAAIGAKPGILAELTHQLEIAKVNIKSVITSQTAINILLSKRDLGRAHRSIDAASISAVAETTFISDISVIAVVGEGIMEQAGVMARILGSVASHSINLQTIVMGASPVSAYLVVHRNDRDTALQTIHSSQFPGNQFDYNPGNET